MKQTYQQSSIMGKGSYRTVEFKNRTVFLDKSAGFDLQVFVDGIDAKIFRRR